MTMGDPWTFRATVANVVDGDTVDLDVDLGFRMRSVQRFRLVGVDTPERGQPGFGEAKLATAVWLDGRDLRALVWKTDRWGRWLTDILDAESGESLSAFLIDQEFGKPYVV